MRIKFFPLWLICITVIGMRGRNDPFRLQRIEESEAPPINAEREIELLIESIYKSEGEGAAVLFFDFLDADAALKETIFAVIERSIKKNPKSQVNKMLKLAIIDGIHYCTDVSDNEKLLFARIRANYPEEAAEKDEEYKKAKKQLEKVEIARTASQSIINKISALEHGDQRALEALDLQNQMMWNFIDADEGIKMEIFIVINKLIINNPASEGNKILKLAVIRGIHHCTNYCTDVSENEKQLFASIRANYPKEAAKEDARGGGCSFI